MKQIRSSIVLAGAMLGVTVLMAIVATLALAQGFSLTVKTVGQGTVDVSSPPPYTENQQVSLTALPDVGWTFVGWDAEGGQDDWWNSNWNYRFPVAVSANGFQRKNKAADIEINFDAVIKLQNPIGTLDPNSIRVIEVNQAGNVIDEDVPFQFDVLAFLNPNFNPAKPAQSICSTPTPGRGTVTLILEGTTGANATRYYDIYFDVMGKGIPAPVVASQIAVTDGVFDPPKPDPGNQLSIKVESTTGTYFYQKEAAAFSSLNDVDGNDWINFSGTPGSLFGGEYRGIPNLVIPTNGGQFHPGNKKSASCLINSGPLKATIYSNYKDGLRWAAIWEIYPTYARMTVLSARYSYWFLYEGTPGGTFNGNTDYIVRPDGTQTLLSGGWKAALSPEQWVYVADPGLNRSLFVAQSGQDNYQDMYESGDGKMTVLGFGRNGTNALIPLTQVPQKFSIGLIDTVTFADAAPLIRGAYMDLTTTVGEGEVYGGNALGNKNPVPFVITGNNTVTATFALKTYELNLTAVGSGTVAKIPNKTAYGSGEQVEISATPASGWVFSGWSGDVGGIDPSANPVMVTMSSDRAIAANFTAAYKIETSVVGQGSIALDPDKPGYLSGEVVTVTAVADPGWTFANWTGGLTGSTTSQEITVLSNMSIGATFTEDAYTLAVGSSGNGTADWEPKQATYSYGDVVTLTATADPGYVFSNWSGTITGEEAQKEIIITGNTTATANFEEIVNYTLTTLVSGNGSVQKQPDLPLYETGQVVTLTAVPATGAVFTGWSGDLVSQDNPAEITISKDTTVTASFGSGGPFTLSVSTEGQGTVKIEPNKAEYALGEEVTLTPTPVAGWVFANWKGDLTGLANPTTITMDKSKAITAVFIFPATTGPASDNFDNCVLDPMWTFVDPLGDGTVKVNGHQGEISVPADVQHNIFSEGNNVPRIMQMTEDEDFAIEVKFDSRLQESGALQGVVVEQDAQNFIRFDFFRRDNEIKVYAAALANLQPVVVKNSVTTTEVNSPLYLRVSRQGVSWGMSYSTDGVSWNPAYAFDHAIVVQQIGIFAGNFKIKGAIPAHTAVFDYFYNMANPAKPADQSLLTVDVVGNGQVQRSAADPYTCGQSVTLTAAPNTGAQFTGWSGDAGGSQNPLPLVLNVRKSVTATFTGGTEGFKLALPFVVSQ